MDFREFSKLAVHLVWPQEVTFKSAERLVDLAKKQNRSFEILGHPRRVEDDDDDDDELVFETAPCSSKKKN